MHTHIQFQMYTKYMLSVCERDDVRIQTVFKRAAKVEIELTMNSMTLIREKHVNPNLSDTNHYHSTGRLYCNHCHR